jgi:hypothetical protein
MKRLRNFYLFSYPSSLNTTSAAENDFMANSFRLQQCVPSRVVEIKAFAFKLNNCIVDLHIQNM